MRGFATERLIALAHADKRTEIQQKLEDWGKEHEREESSDDE